MLRIGRTTRLSLRTLLRFLFAKVLNTSVGRCLHTLGRTAPNLMEREVSEL